MPFRYNLMMKQDFLDHHHKNCEDDTLLCCSYWLFELLVLVLKS